ncbi:tyrosine-type recombinase/integrase [Komagataeibacter sp. AV436]|uniref:Tyrosine-type recombinase/integrase n=1 Tax=Komagataeibacter melomenusus TaxID=2766578 RepID=A0ABX2AHZ6_9PROT|nr:tyrosine-type recombinase/integrase [Komagataeibacter melomenusus]MBV1831632.1 tyrosine-type recombinase/integrase [Komagataeibacter melomenusus]NPC67352.1 tyrosine-type recombinase/integrase [Komagataeibacter melomenusus]
MTTPQDTPTREATATLRAYRADWVHFTQWCAEHAIAPIPAAPEGVAAYLRSLGTFAPATIRRRLAAIGKMHRFNGLAWDVAHPLIRAALAEMLEQARRPAPPPAVVTPAMLRAMSERCTDGVRGLRDRCLLLFGFAGALRRSELVGLQVEDVRLTPQAVMLTVRDSHEAPTIALPVAQERMLCPALAFTAWQQVAHRQTGPLFRAISKGERVGGRALTPYAVTRILQRRALMAEVPPATVARLSAHALRAGFIVEALRHGMDATALGQRTRYRDPRALRPYADLLAHD